MTLVIILKGRRTYLVSLKL